MLATKRFKAVALVAIVCSAAVYAPAYFENRPSKLTDLTQGNQMFISGKMTNPRLDEQRRLDTTRNGQKPFATILTCSDSRIPVERIFDQGIGDLFVIRVAGNVAGESEIATIEYGVGHLGTPLLIVMGHKKCGAVAAAAENADVHGHLPQLLSHIKPAVETVRRQNRGMEGAELAAASISENVRQSMSDLILESSTIRGLIDSQKVAMVGAIYDIESGKVEWLGPHPNESSLISQAKAADDTQGHTHGSADSHGH